VELQQMEKFTVIIHKQQMTKLGMQPDHSAGYSRNITFDGK
jgi:hypothetical protein